MFSPFRSNISYSYDCGSLHKKVKFSIKDFFSKYDQIRSFLENLIFRAAIWYRNVTLAWNELIDVEFEPRNCNMKYIFMIGLDNRILNMTAVGSWKFFLAVESSS